MSRLLMVAMAAALASPALAQTADPHAGHQPPPTADPHAGHAPAPADPHAGHSAEPPAASDPHAGHAMPETPADSHAGHAPAGAAPPLGGEPAPPPPADHLADRTYGPAAMERARAVLRREHGGARFAKTMLDTFELRPGRGREVYAWEGEFRYGGDIDRFALKTEGEGEVDGRLEQAEVQGLYSRAIGPYFDLQAGVRHDFQPGPRRTYATLGVEGLAPYWFEVEGALFLSNKGELSARFEGSYDLRLTQRLILQPRAELNLSAERAPELGLGSGLTSAEFGLRLRYEFRREVAPYVGVHYERAFGGAAALARAAGEPVDGARLVLGVRAWF